jgi:crossover junction endodeoxyribonuclease RuvC
MLVIGIDPGTARTGFGLVRLTQDGALNAIEFGVISTSSDLQMPRRLLHLFNDLNLLLQRYAPVSAAVEKLYFQRNVSTALSVGQARGVALLSLSQADIPVSEYNPREIKQAVAGYGAADKRQIQEMVRTLLGLESTPRPDDVADALAIAICHIHSSQTRRRLEELG